MRFMIAFGVRKFANSQTLECFPSQARLASAARVTTRTVQIELAALRDRGHLETNCPANRRLGNRYRLLVKPAQLMPHVMPDGPTQHADIANDGSHEKFRSMRTGIHLEKPSSCEPCVAWPCEPGVARNLVREPLNPTPTTLLPSSGGACAEELDTEVEQNQTVILATDKVQSDGFRAFVLSYPFDSTMAFDEAERLFGALSIEDRRKAIRYAKIYAADLKRRGRAQPKDIARWLRSREFDKLDAAAGGAGAQSIGVASGPVFVARGTDAWAAWRRAKGRDLPLVERAGLTGWWFPSPLPDGGEEGVGGLAGAA